MAKLVSKCPVCNKPAEEKSHQIMQSLGFRIINLMCGHTYTELIAKKKDWELLTTIIGPPKSLYKYQGEGYEFARESGFRCLIADEPGLGKTWQADVCLRLHPDELLPVLIICKSALKIQQMKALLQMCGPDFMPQIITNSKEKIHKIFDVVIATYDILWRITKRQLTAAESVEKEIRTRLNLSAWDILPEDEESKIPKIENIFKDFGFKTVILDECQQIKNPESRRAKQVQEICRDIPHIIATSGSPIENNAGEYYTILNILRPEMFRTRKSYIENYCDYYTNGRGITKVGGIRDLDYFREKTKDFIIRRRKCDVLPDLPHKERKFVSCEFASARIESEYGELQKEFEDFYYENEGEKDFAQGILAKMAKLRHKAGINKVLFATEFITDWILDTEHSRKLVIMLHHQDVGQMLYGNLCREFEKLRQTGIQIDNPLTYTADLNSMQRNQVVEDFKKKENVRVVICSTLAAGEGLDGLQEVAEDGILLERHWNPKKEEQAEDRLERIGARGGKDSKITWHYILSAGTIDEYFTELVERKRANVDQTLDGVEYSWDETSLIIELGRILAAKGGKKWRLI